MEIDKSFIKEYEKVDKEANEAYVLYNTLSESRSKLRYEMRKFVIDNKLYISMEELKKFKNKELSSIELVLSDGSTKTLWDDELFSIDENGHVHYSSYEGGIFEWSDTKQGYVGHYYGTSKEAEVVGFMYIEFDNVWKEPTKSMLALEEKSKPENIIKKYLKVK